MPSVEEHLNALAEQGTPDEVIAELRKAYEASPIRQERDAARAEATTLRSKLAETNFKAAGVKVNPAALNVPSDLDVTDVEKVKGWAGEMGLVETKPDTPPEELETHQRIASASTGAGEVPNASEEARNKAMNATTEAEFWANAHASGLTTRTK